MIYKKEYDSLDFICMLCGWTGKGIAFVNNNSNQIYRVQDLRCPDCFSYCCCLLTNTNMK